MALKYGNSLSSFHCYKWDRIGWLYDRFSSLITYVQRWSVPFCQWRLPSFTHMTETVASKTWRAQLVLAEHYALPSAASRATWSTSISMHHWLNSLQGLFLFYITVFTQEVKKVGNTFWLRFTSLSLATGWEGVRERIGSKSSFCALWTSPVLVPCMCLAQLISLR